MTAELAVLSAGAAQSLLTALADELGIRLHGEFGAVGAMRERLFEGAPCDLIVLTQKLISELPGVLASATLGRVPTCIGVREADAPPNVSTREALRQSLTAADAIYFPDPEKATAGAHFKKVLQQLNVTEGWKTFPNGAWAMREMAKAREPRVIGCTQATEIMATPGARLVAPLPGEFALETLYAAAVCRDSPVAYRFLVLLAGERSRALRMKCGFEL